MQTCVLGKTSVERAVELACGVLSKGGIIVYPTDTLYGLGVDPFNKPAVRRLYDLKKRDAGKPMAIGVASVPAIGKYARMHPRAKRLMELFLPGPLTVLLEKKDERIPWQKAGIRVPDLEFDLALFERFGPVTITSANLSGQGAPYSLEELKAAFGEGVGLYIEGSMPMLGKASTVVDCTGGEVKVIREGVISTLEILDALEARDG
jgi:L-threonylcarbamoyladenylate synthase